MSVSNEAERLKVLRLYQILDTDPEPIFDYITALAAHIFDVPIACVTLIDDRRIWMKSTYGMDAREVPKDPGLCTRAIEGKRVHHLRDTHLDPESRKHLAVDREGGVRFYAGAPLRSPEGFNLGTFCIMGLEVRDMSESEKRTLELLAKFAMSEIERHRSAMELHATRQSLNVSEIHNHTLTELAPVGIFRTDSRGECLYVNPSWSRITGITPEDALGSGWSRTLEPESLHSVMAKWEQVLRDPQPFRCECRFRKNADEVVTVLGHIVPEQDDQGQLLGFIGTITDISDQRRLEAKVQEGIKLESLALMAGGVAHDFNNVLAVILGSVNMAVEDLPEGSPCRAHLENIDQAAQRAADLCSQLLAYAGKGRLSETVFDLNELIDGIFDLLQISTSKRAEVVRSPRTDIPAIEGDSTQFRQVVLNLIINAAEAIDEQPGRIELQVGTEYLDADALDALHLGDQCHPGQFVKLEVRDNGCGLDSEGRSRLFDPFYSTKVPGRGLGMAAVLGIVRAHRGAVGLQSRKEEGTTIQIFVPASTKKAEPMGEGRPSDGLFMRGEGTVLVVDDEAMIRRMAQSILRKAGFRVLLAADGKQALELFERQAEEIDLVLLDMVMPNFDGAQAFTEFQRLRADVKVILTSGYNEQEAMRRVSGLSTASFIRKPYRPQDLVEKVHGLLQAETA